MAAKGSIAKEQLIRQILEVFPNSFAYNDGKEVRINCEENGLPVQIKLTFTCAKVAVSAGADNEMPALGTSETAQVNSSVPMGIASLTQKDNTPQEPSQEEKERLANLLTKLNFN